MYKRDFKVEYQPSNISSQEAEFRIFKALEILININDIYDKEDNIQSVLSD